MPLYMAGSNSLCRHETAGADDASAGMRYHIGISFRWQQVLASGVGAGSFCYIFGGTLADGAAAFVAGLVLYLYLLVAVRGRLSKIAANITGGALVMEEAARRGEVLSQARREAAGALQARVQEELRQLDMPKVQFQTEFTPKGGEAGMDETGLDEVQFLMSANLGEALKPIQKVASGGELARIMLALKNVLAEGDQIGTLVFDEVDTGVSGRAAQKVAEKMAQVARGKQVLCVTHLPQIAAMADTHFSVQKGEREGRTYTRLERLDRSQRREELARLIGGASITPSLLESAEELLRQAEQQKQA